LKELSSPQNSIVKQIIDLKTKASSRKKEGLCVIEGLKELEIAIQSDIRVEKILMDAAFELEFTNIAAFRHIQEVYKCPASIMEKIAIRDTKQKVIAIAQTRYRKIDDIVLSSNPFVLILENIEKPGNIGALLRTSDAANVDVIFCTDMQTDLYNHNVIRNSLGCVFSKQIVLCTNQEAIEFCRHNHIDTYATFLHTEETYFNCDFKQPTAFVFGTESTGISNFWQTNADHLIKIPMLGMIDSMNVSNSASILLYEVVRQRISGK
jgi:TrmH family RNA methyltransferase